MSIYLLKHADHARVLLGGVFINVETLSIRAAKNQNSFLAEIPHQLSGVLWDTNNA